MTGLIDVGGGMKCAYSAGLYDYFMDNGIEFDYYLGVSAGSMNLLSYMAYERGRNIKIYRAATNGNEYLGINHLVHNGAYMNYKKVSDDFYSDKGFDPFNFEAFFANPKPFVISTTHAVNGNTVYFDRKDMTTRERILDIVSASCCLPLVSKPITIDGVDYYDGGLAEPIPFRKAFGDGCDKIVVVLSAPADKKREKLYGADIAATAFLREYPNIDDVLEDRHVIYNYLIRCVKEYVENGKALLFSPAAIPGATVLTKDAGITDKLYDNGYRDGKENHDKIIEILK